MPKLSGYNLSIDHDHLSIFQISKYIVTYSTYFFFINEWKMHMCKPLSYFLKLVKEKA